MFLKHIPRHTPLLLTATLLAACGGGGGESPTTTPPPPPPPPAPTQFELLDAENNRLSTALAALPATRALTADLPTGSATYAGVIPIIFDATPDDGVIGELTLTVDFDQSTFTGSADNFATFAGDDTAGSLAIVGGNIGTEINSGEAVAGSNDITGTVTFASGPRTIAATTLGQFTANNADLMTGLLTGTATAGTDSASIRGAWIAEK